MKVYHSDKMFAKLGFQFCQILNKPSKYCQRVLEFCQILNEPSKYCQSYEIWSHWTCRKLLHLLVKNTLTVRRPRQEGG